MVSFGPATLARGVITRREKISVLEANAGHTEHWSLRGGGGGSSDLTLLLDCTSCKKPLPMNSFLIHFPPPQDVPTQ